MPMSKLGHYVFVINMKKVLIIFSGIFIPSFAMAQFANPLTGTGESLSITSIIGSIAQIILALAGLIAVVYIIIGGTQTILGMRGGNDDQIDNGKKTLAFAIIGLLVAFGGFVITNAVLQGIGTIFGS